MIRQLAHVCFFTDQLDAMVAFYRDQLGFPVKFTLDTDDGELMGYYFDCGNTTFIEVFDQQLAVKQWGGQVQTLFSGQSDDSGAAWSLIWTTPSTPVTGLPAFMTQ